MRRYVFKHVFKYVPIIPTHDPSQRLTRKVKRATIAAGVPNTINTLHKEGESMFDEGQEEEDVPSPETDLEEYTRTNHTVLDIYMTEVRHLALLSPEQEAELGRRVLEGDLDARRELAEHNLRLVLWVAHKYQWSGVAPEDLVQQGNIGLMTAAEKYDYRRGKFGSYAVWWIRQTIYRFIQDFGSVVRIPIHLQEVRDRILRAERELRKGRQSTPSIAEVAALVQLSEEKVHKVLLRARVDVVSFDDPLSRRGSNGNGDEALTIGSILPDHHVMSPEIHLEALDRLRETRERLEETLEMVRSGLGISERNVNVFYQKYGLDDLGEERTLEDVAQMQTPPITRERVRQILLRIWERVQENGGTMTEEQFLVELALVDALQKIVGEIS